ncbi:MAG TPA: WD40 repeat domain-containing protein, partial [Myxococcaceae bacterium]|nr:WD40 repeat domain-containing protein [Myxococcaceae bacterium]
ERALQQAPGDRYESAEALAKDLRAYQAGNRVRAYEYRSWELVKKFVAANRGLSAATAVAAVILLVAAAIIVHQLRVARMDLARSFIDRAKSAESISDWARAAGYYAASRIEHDSAEARWGFALAAERVSPRASLRRGPPGAFVDVGPGADGRLITLGRRNGVLIGSDLGTEKELWRAELPESASTISLKPRQLVSMLSASPRNPTLTLNGRTLLDAATGKFLASLDADEGIPCLRTPFPPPVLVSSAGLVTAPVEGSRPTVLSATVERESSCIVSDDGREVAFDDARGSVHLWNLVDRKELAARYAPDVREMIFTTHGLALVRPTVIHVFGGPEGDFLVDIPKGSGTPLRPRPGGIAVSADGHRVVLDRASGHHADIVDLQSRTVVSSFSFLPGEPRLAFSSDGKQVLAAGLLGDSALGTWKIRSPVPRKTVEGSPYMTVQPSRDGKRFVVFLEGAPTRWELFDAAGTRLLSGTFGQNGEFALTPDGRRIVTRDDDGVIMRDADDGRIVWQLGCRDCYRLQPSADGRRLFTSSGTRLALWSVDSPDPIWTDTGRISHIAAGMDISLDGSRIAWANGATAHVHTVGNSAELETTFAEAIRDVKFSADGQRLLLAGRGEITLWSLQPWKRLWSVLSPFAGPVTVEYSSDESVLLLDYRSMGTVLLDAATGGHLATISVSKPRAVYAADKVLPSLKEKISLGDGRWELWSFPEPDLAPPRESLARITSATGLELVGVELVDTASAGVEGGETRSPK